MADFMQLLQLRQVMATILVVFQSQFFLFINELLLMVLILLKLLKRCMEYLSACFTYIAFCLNCGIMAFEIDKFQISVSANKLSPTISACYFLF